jgi:hypothetical protein
MAVYCVLVLATLRVGFAQPTPTTVWPSTSSPPSSIKTTRSSAGVLGTGSKIVECKPSLPGPRTASLLPRSLWSWAAPCLVRCAPAQVRLILTHATQTGQRACFFNLQLMFSSSGSSRASPAGCAPWRSSSATDMIYANSALVELADTACPFASADTCMD